MMTLRNALERSVENAEVVRVVVQDVEVAIREVRRIWRGRFNCVVTDAGIDIWGWTCRTPKNEQDFHLLVVKACNAHLGKERAA
jgi:hypothetical protein